MNIFNNARKRKPKSTLFRTIYWRIFYPFLILTTFFALKDLYSLLQEGDGSLTVAIDQTIQQQDIRQHPIPQKPDDTISASRYFQNQYSYDSNIHRQEEDTFDTTDWWTEIQSPTFAPTPKSTEFAQTLKAEQQEFTKEAIQQRQNNNTNNNQTNRQTSWKFAKTNPTSHKITFGTPIVPPTKLGNTINTTNTVLLVLSAGSSSHFIRRQTIRKTWKGNNTNVYFIIGQTEKAALKKDNDDDDNSERVFLRHEQHVYGDLVEIPMQDDYTLLPEKVVQAYAWALETFTNLQWLVKVDDDTFVRVKALEHYLEKYNSHIPMLIGKIVPKSEVARNGKWAEHAHYQNTYYPYWPQGSSGHIVSKPIAKYIVDNSQRLHRYQGEDVSIGIWLDEAQKLSNLQVTYIQAESMMTMDGIEYCKKKPQYLMIGHDFTPDGMLHCQQIKEDKNYENAWMDGPADF